VLGPVTWEAKPLAFPVQSSDRCMWRLDVDCKEYLISLIVETATNIKQQPGSFEGTRQSMLRRCRLFIEVGGLTFEHLFYIGTKYNFV